jgi:hypothetical protein
MTTAENDSVKPVTLLSVLSPSNAPGSPVFGYAHANDRAAIDSMLAIPQVQDVLPADLVLRWSVKPIAEGAKIYQLVALEATPSGKPSLGEEDIIKDASDDFDRITNQSVVSMSMNQVAAEKWAQITRDNIGRCIAIVLDNQVYSFPVVNTEIAGGNSQISGNFTIDEAKDLATVLKSGKMSASVEVKQKAVIGPSLGQEAIDSGIISFIIAIVFIWLFAVVLKLFPVSGMETAGSINWSPMRRFWDRLYHYALPLIVMTFCSLGGMTRYVRASMIEALSMDCIRTARAKGLREKAVIYSHAWRNALIPIITLVIGWFLGIFSGSLMIENIFGLNGVGKVYYDALTNNDNEVVLALQMFYIFISLVGNLITDVVYGFVDPRVRVNK